MNTSGYAVGGSQAVGTGGASTDKTTEYWSLQKCKRAYLDYLGSKRAEIDEQQQSRRYRHGVHWTTEQVDALNKRKQPVVTYNRIGRKIDGVIGLVEKLRKDPKAAPRTPKHEQGAELATAVLRYVLDQQEWKAKSPIVAENGAVDGIGGIEIELTALIPARLFRCPLHGAGQVAGRRYRKGDVPGQGGRDRCGG
jgi:hypothetical protein